MVSMGIEHLQQLMQEPVEEYEIESAAESAMAATSDRESSVEQSRHREREHRKDKKNHREQKYMQRTPSPSTLRSPSPPRRSRRPRSKSRKPAGKDINPTNWRWCKKYGEYGITHATPKNIPHTKCNYNKNWKGWMPEWVWKKIDITYQEYADYDE